MKKLFASLLLLVAVSAAILNKPDSVPAQEPAFTQVPILEYHAIGPKEYRWTRSVANFKKDLQWLYNHDYVLLSIEDYADSDFSSIPEGKKPVVLSFDDGKPNHLTYLKDGTIDPNCAIGLLDAFHAEHPEFGSAAVFYVNANPFGQRDLIKQKMQYLFETGRQIGYHTLGHVNLRAMSAAQVTKEIQKQTAAFKEILPAGMRVSTLAYPHGLSPRGGLPAEIRVGLLVGAESARLLTDPKADALRIPRIQAIDSEWLRHFKRKPGEV
jgi:peptidoglycan/xylan/chitin deacetylase (PgdA/CDA1 family)